MRVSKLALLGAACFVTFAGSAAFAAEYAAGTPVRVSGPSLLDPDCDSGPSIPGTLNFRNYEVEPYVAVNPHDPSHMVVAWQQDRWTWGGANGMASAVSRDGGRTWSETLIPGLTKCSGGTLYRGGDDWLTFAKNGNLYHSAVVFNPLQWDSNIVINMSTNGGETWDDPIAITQDVYPAINDKESITADPYNAAYVYASWVKTEIGETSSKVTAWFSRTTDGGKTWEIPRKIVDPGENDDVIGNQIVVLPGGELVNIFSHSNTQLWLVRSQDRGETWGPVEVVTSMNFGYLIDPATGELVATGARICDIAVDPESGALYVTWADTRFDGVTPAILLTKSRDGGRTWSTPARINTSSAAAFTPSVAVTKNGVVGVSYFDVRSDTTDPTEFLADHWMLTSRDGGTTWQETHIAGPFDLRSAPQPGLPMHMLGDYVGLAAAGKSFVAAYAVPNSGDPANPTDIYVSVLEKEKDGKEDDGEE